MGVKPSGTQEAFNFGEMVRREGLALDTRLRRGAPGLCPIACWCLNGGVKAHENTIEHLSTPTELVIMTHDMLKLKHVEAKLRS